MDTATDLTPTEVIDRARTARHTEQAAAFEQLQMALAWAHLHPCPTHETPAHWGEADLHGEGLIPLAGPGAPWVAEFAPADLGAALGMTLDQAKTLIGDALETAHRLPRLWDLASQGRAPIWRIRLIAQQTRDLPADAALMADRTIAATPDQIHRVNTTMLVNEARLFYDPDRAAAEEEHALTRRGVWLRHSHTPATTDLTMTLDTPDAHLLEATIARIAADLHDLGDTDPLDTRRARAAGILADPQHALDLMSHRPAATTRGAGNGALNLYAHVNLVDLHHLDLTDLDVTGDPDAATGAVTLKRLGAATTRLLADWITHHTGTGTRITLRPVIHLTADHPDHAVDQHDPPEAMREHVFLRDTHCVFPGCRRDSRTCDLDHITEYLDPDHGGPPGQTHPTNLAPLCRTHHRIKTHTTWHYQRHHHGTYTWTSPTGHHYDVTPVSRQPTTSH